MYYNFRKKYMWDTYSILFSTYIFWSEYYTNAIRNNRINDVCFYKLCNKDEINA